MAFLFKLRKRVLIFSAALALLTSCLPISDRTAEKMLVWDEGPFDPPVVMKSTEDTITVRYTSAGEYPQHKEAEKMITEHCKGPFKGKRAIRHGWYTVEAKCL